MTSTAVDGAPSPAQAEAMQADQEDLAQMRSGLEAVLDQHDFHHPFSIGSFNAHVGHNLV
jgi:hypothetical protein